MRLIFAASALCAVLSTLAVPSAADQITVYGSARTYTIVAPAAKGPQPTIIMLHDAKGAGAAIAQTTKLGTLAPQQGFVAVFPDGLRQQWNFFPAGKEPDFFVKASKASGGVPDDGAFLKGLIDDLVRRGIADPRRIYIAGESNGSLMALRMLCTDANLFAGAALLAPAMPETLGANCHPQRPVPVLLIKGTKDDVLPYGGGLVEPEETFRIWPTDRLIGFLQQINGESGPPQNALLPRKVPNVVAIDRWTACPGTPLTVYRVIDGAHIAPADLNEGQVVLDFFASPTVNNSCVASLQPPGAGANPGGSPGSGTDPNAAQNPPGTNPGGTPGANGPGANSPGANGPGANGPGANGPGANGPGANGPGANGPGANGPGANGPGATPGAGNDPGQGANPANPGAPNGPDTASGPNGTDPNAPGGPQSPGSDTAGLGPPSDPGNPGGDTAGLGPPPDSGNPGDTAGLGPPPDPGSPGSGTAGLGPPPDPGSPMGGLGPPSNPPMNYPPATTTALAPPSFTPLPPIFIPSPIPPDGNSGVNCSGPQPCARCNPIPAPNPGTASGGTKIIDTFTPPNSGPLTLKPNTPIANAGVNCGFTAADGKQYTGISGCQKGSNGMTTCTGCSGTTSCTTRDTVCYPPTAATSVPPDTGMIHLRPQALPPPVLPTNTASNNPGNVCAPKPTHAATHESSPKKKEVEKKQPRNNHNAENAAANAAATAATATAIMGLVGAFGHHHGGGGGGGGGGYHGGGGGSNVCHHR